MDADLDAQIRMWSVAQRRVADLVRGVTAEQAATRVPACPDWTVRDLLAHMVGLGADVLAGDEPDDHNERWTARQVRARQGSDVAALVREWDELAPRLVEHMRGHDARPLNDVVIHEGDLRGALHAEPVDDDGVVVVRDRMAGRVAKRIADAGLAPVRLMAPTWDAALGDGEPGLTLQAPAYDLFRAVTSRRSAAQLRAWVTQGDPEPYLPVLAVLGPLPEHDLTV